MTICVAQAQHGSAPDIAGQGVANPTSLILSAAMLLDWIGSAATTPPSSKPADSSPARSTGSSTTPRTRTRDIGGTLGTDEFTAAVLAAMNAS